MKRTIFLLLSGIVFFLNSINAQEEQEPKQKKGYATMGGGYSFNNSSDRVGVNSNSNKMSVVSGSLGSGINIGVAFGFLFNDYLGIELGVSFLQGNTITVFDEFIFSGLYGNDEINFSSTMFRVSPSFVIRSGITGVLTPYAKFGPLLGLGAINVDLKSKLGLSTHEQKMVMNGGMAFGYNASMGSIFTFNNGLKLFTEVTLIGLSYTPTKGEITEYRFNGEDKLNNLTISEKETEFVDEIPSNNNGNSSTSQPSKALKSSYEFGSIGVNVGIHFSF